MVHNINILGKYTFILWPMNQSLYLLIFLVYECFSVSMTLFHWDLPLQSNTEGKVKVDVLNR